MVKFLVLALFYGDHPALAGRCGHSLRESEAPQRGLTEPRESGLWHIWSRGR